MNARHITRNGILCSPENVDFFRYLCFASIFSLVLACTLPTGTNRLKNTLGPNSCGFGTQGNSRSVVYSPTLPKYPHFSLLSSYILTLIVVSVPIFQKDLSCSFLYIIRLGVFSLFKGITELDDLVM